MNKRSILFISLAIFCAILLLIGENYLKVNPTYATVLGFITFSIGMGLSLLLLYEILEFIVKKQPIEAPLVIFPVLSAFGYSLAKKAITGVPLESMGAKGITPAILRIVGYLTGEIGTPIEVFGVWLGFITMGASIALVFFAILEALSERITYDKAVFVSILGGFGIASGFVTGHLAMTSFLYPFVTIGGTVVYFPFYVVMVIISLMIIFGAIYLLRSK